MDNNMNLSKQQMEKISKLARDKMGIDINSLNGSSGADSLNDFINKKLSPDKASSLKKILSDKEATKRILNTPEALALMKKLSEGK